MDVNRPEQTDDNRYHPMLTGPGWDDLALWKVFDALPKKQKDILLSVELPRKLKQFQEASHFGMDVVGMISYAIRRVILGKVPIEEVAKRLGPFFSERGADPKNAEKVAAFIRDEILTIQPAPDEEELAAVEAVKAVAATRAKLSLLQALGKYPKLGEQPISASRITLKGNPEPVRGSLVNWLRVYRDELGVGHHDPVLRAKFLFNSPNAKDITSEERERLNLILRSVEENTPLDIDTVKPEIIFPSFQVTERSAPPKVAGPQPAPVSRPFVPTPPVAPAAAPKPVQPAPASPFVPTPPISAPVRPSAEPPRGLPLSPENRTPVAAPPAPKRQEMFRTIRPASTRDGRFSDEDPSVRPPAPFGGGSRVEKGLSFSVSKKEAPSMAAPTPAPTPPAPVPQKPAADRGDAQGGGFSFSSKHAFQAERADEGGLSIDHPAEKSLPSGQAFFKSKAPSTAPSSKPTLPKPAPSRPMSPFQIRPAGHRDQKSDDMGRIVDLRSE